MRLNETELLGDAESVEDSDSLSDGDDDWDRGSESDSRVADKESEPVKLGVSDCDSNLVMVCDPPETEVVRLDVSDRLIVAEIDTLSVSLSVKVNESVFEGVAEREKLLLRESVPVEVVLPSVRDGDNERVIELEGETENDEREVDGDAQEMVGELDALLLVSVSSAEAVEVSEGSDKLSDAVGVPGETENDADEDRVPATDGE